MNSYNRYVYEQLMREAQMRNGLSGAGGLMGFAGFNQSPRVKLEDQEDEGKKKRNQILLLENE